MFGNLIDGNLIYAPSTLVLDGMRHYHPTDEMYVNQGYLQVIDTPYPEVVESEEKYYISSWEEVDGQIVKVWEESEPPIEPTPTPTNEERISRLETNLETTMQAVDYLILNEVNTNA